MSSTNPAEVQALTLARMVLNAAEAVAAIEHCEVSRATRSELLQLLWELADASRRLNPNQ